MTKLSPSQEILLKKEIDRLDKGGKQDYQSLMRQVEDKRIEVELNPAQAAASVSTANTLVLEWGRATGKTTIIADRILKILRYMPRSSGLFIGPTYQAILTRIIPSLIHGLEMYGLYEGLHYFVNRKPPVKWQSTWGKPYKPPSRYDNAVIFWNGVVMYFISQEVKGDGRGLNIDWIIADESALLNGQKLESDTGATLRGSNVREFEGKPYFGSSMYCSSTPLTPEGQWFLEFELKAYNDPQIDFISANCLINKQNLRKGYLEEERKKAYTQWIFDAEYLNVRPKFQKDSFYMLLDADKHCYNNFDYGFYDRVGKQPDCRGDGDLTKGVPLILGVDWGAAINCLTVNQHLKSVNEYRTLKSMYVLGENKEMQDDLFEQFHNYYQYHQATDPTIHLWYDNTGNLRTGNTRITRAEQAKKLLEAKGWKVQLRTTGGSNPLHAMKYELWMLLLKEQLPSAPRYRMNKANCRELYLSMRNSKAIQDRNGEIKKDKSIEKRVSVPRQEATDLSDANDAPIFGMFQSLLSTSLGFVSMLRISNQ